MEAGKMFGWAQKFFLSCVPRGVELFFPEHMYRHGQLNDKTSDKLVKHLTSAMLNP
jgi:hypothetical protein